jgi:hypothetical protein
MTLLPRSKKSGFSLWNKALLLFILSVDYILINAQPLAAYHDNQNKFYIFDRGKTIEAEYLPVQSFSVGGKCVLYIDNTSHLKMYYKGEITTLSVNAPDTYLALDHLAVYSIGGEVRIIDGSRKFTVSTNSIMYYAQDSLVTFYDASQSVLAAYYNGRVQMLEDGLTGNVVNKFGAGDNLVAYISSKTQDFKIFYHGKTGIIEPFLSGGNFRTGKDIVAYVNQADSKFRIFYRGEIIEAEEFPPESYAAGDGIAAYIDNTGSFRVFSEGEIMTISSIRPDFYRVQNKMVLYGEKGYFKVWYNYKTYTLETFIPKAKELLANWNTIVYIDLNRNVKIFNEGETKVLTYDLAESIFLYRDVVVVNKGMNNHNVYWQGRKY